MLDWIKLSEASEKAGIPYATLNRYVKSHADHLKIKKEQNTYYIHLDSVAILEKIRTLYKDGLTEKQVDKELSFQGIPITVNPKENEVATLEKTVKTMQEGLLSLNEKADKQEKFNQELLHQLQQQQEYIQQQQEYIDGRLDERDKNLMIAIRETQKLVASAREKKWWQFWK